MQHSGGNILWNLHSKYSGENPRMNLIQNLFTRVRQVRLEELADELAERAVDEVRRRLSGAVHSMTLAEARGYVRARAARPLQRQLQFLLADGQGISPKQAQELLGRATERTVLLVVRDVVRDSRHHQLEQAA